MKLIKLSPLSRKNPINLFHVEKLQEAIGYIEMLISKFTRIRRFSFRKKVLFVKKILFDQKLATFRSSKI